MAFLKWHPLIKQKPFAKQLAFLSWTTPEALYAGSLGGGKSSTLLMSALQNMDVPGYSCLILRRTLADLEMSGALLDRARGWIHDKPGVRYQASTHSYHFETVRYDTIEDAQLKRNPKRGQPASLTFGYLGEARAEDRYTGAEYQRCIIDELTQHERSDYAFMFSRLRKTRCSVHGELDANGEPRFEPGCWECEVKASVITCMRGATNPGNVGHAWVKEWFSIMPDGDIELARERGDHVTYSGRNPKRPFLASSFLDNPWVDNEMYEEMLENMDPTRREMLRFGQWDVIYSALFKQDWFKKYQLDTRDGITYRYGVLLDTLSNNLTYRSVKARDMMIFVTVDPAASVGAGLPEDLFRGMELDSESEATSSRSAAAVWGCLPDKKCFLLDLFVGRVEIPDLVRVLKALDRKWRPNFFRIEKNGLGMGVFQYAKAEGLPVKGYARGTGDKIVHATDAIRLADSGHFYVPESAEWLADWSAEVYNWVGHKDQGDDIVDCLSEAGHVLAGMTKFVSQAENSAHRTWNSKGGVVFGTDGTALDASGFFMDTPAFGDFGYDSYS